MKNINYDMLASELDAIKMDTLGTANGGVVQPKRTKESACKRSFWPGDLAPD